MHYVYYLIDPRNNQPFYIGKGTGTRMFCHEKYCRTDRYFKSNPIKTARIREILDLGLKIVYSVVPFENEDEALEAEAVLIAQYGKLYNGTGTLTNLADGGFGGKKPTKPVHQYSLNGNLIASFECAAEASGALGCSVASIRSALSEKGSAKSAGGFLWSYDKRDSLQAWCHNLLSQVDQYDKRGNLVASYDTVSEASKATGVDAGNISGCCSKTLKTAGKFVWRYKGEEFGLTTHKASRRVQQLDKVTGELVAEFASVKEAGERCSIEKTNISRCCNGKIKSAGGYAWKYPE